MFVAGRFKTDKNIKTKRLVLIKIISGQIECNRQIILSAFSAIKFRKSDQVPAQKISERILIKRGGPLFDGQIHCAVHVIGVAGIVAFYQDGLILAAVVDDLDPTSDRIAGNEIGVFEKRMILEGNLKIGGLNTDDGQKNGRKNEKQNNCRQNWFYFCFNHE